MQLCLSNYTASDGTLPLDASNCSPSPLHRLPRHPSHRKPVRRDRLMRGLMRGTPLDPSYRCLSGKS